jgi:flagellar motor switch protein FliN/FliY
MGEMLSQAEIEALLNGEALSDPDEAQAGDSADSVSTAQTASLQEANPLDNAAPDIGDDSREFIVGHDPNDDFTNEEIDVLGEIGNISMGNSATTLFTLLSRKVNITTPKVTVSTLRKISETYSAPLVVVKVEYTEGLHGSNMLVLKKTDVMAITDLMLGGDGTNVEGEITDLHLSAISEAMNQMIGNASTSLSNVINKKIDISPPNAQSVRINDGSTFLQIVDIDPDETVAVVSFDMTVEGLLDTKILQIQPLPFAKEMIAKLLLANSPEPSAANTAQPPVATLAAQPQYSPTPQFIPPPQYAPQPQYTQPQYAQQPQYMQAPAQQQYVNVQPANFQAFEEEAFFIDKKNIGLVMDVNLEVSVELGRTHKLIREILEFGQGSIIELDKLAGEPVDILVNGKAIAKGEVVVIDESFGVRVTDIIHPSKRI